MALNIARLREVLHYSPETGVFTWSVALSYRGKVGTAAGTVGKNGYRSIGIDGKRYLAHRLAWFYVHGVWPEKHVDHINGDRLENRLDNLRQATVSQNLGNQRRHVDSTSGFKGVSQKRNRWEARISVEGAVRRLGCHDTPELAHAAYVAAARELFGEFARAA